MPKPFDWEDDHEMREDAVGCLLITLGFVAVAVGMVILYFMTRELP